MRQISDDRDALEALIPEGQGSRRQKRGALDWMGRAIGAAFGMATRKQLEEIGQSVRQLGRFSSKNRREIVANRKLLMTLVEITDKTTRELSGRIGRAQGQIQRMSRVMESLTFRLNVTRDKLTLLEEFAKDTRVILHKVALHAGLELHALALIKRRSRELVAAAQKVMDHRLPTELVSPRTLKEMLEAITSFIAKNYGGYRLVYEEPEYYYTAGSIEYERRGSSLILALKVPVTRIDTLFTIYEIQSYVAPVQDAVDESRVVGTQVEGLPDMFAVSHDGSYYIEMERHKWLECSGTRVKICPDLPPLREKTLGACSLALFRGLEEKVPQRCDIVYFPKLNSIQPQIVSIGGGEYVIVTKSKTWIKTCQNHAPVSIRAGLHSRVRLDCDCSLTMEGLYLPPNLENCAEPSQFTVAQVENRPFQEAFYNISRATVKMEGLPEVKSGKWNKGDRVPELKIYMPDKIDSEQDISKFKVRISEAVEALRAGEPIFMKAQDRIEYMAKGGVTVSLTDKVVAILTLYATVASTAAMVALVLLVRRSRAKTIMMAAAAVIPPVRAASTGTTQCEVTSPLAIMGYVIIAGTIVLGGCWMKRKLSEYMMKHFDFCKVRRYASMGHKQPELFDIIVDIRLGQARAWIFLFSTNVNVASCWVEGDLGKIIKGMDETGMITKITWDFEGVRLVGPEPVAGLLKSAQPSPLVKEEDKWLVRYLNHPELKVTLVVAGKGGFHRIPQGAEEQLSAAGEPSSVRPGDEGVTG